jgi:hypothetical protein
MNSTGLSVHGFLSALKRIGPSKMELNTGDDATTVAGSITVVGMADDAATTAGSEATVLPTVVPDGFMADDAATTAGSEATVLPTVVPDVFDATSEVPPTLMGSDAKTIIKALGVPTCLFFPLIILGALFILKTGAQIRCS